MGTFAIPRQMDIIPPGSKMAPKARTIIQYAERGKPYGERRVQEEGGLFGDRGYVAYLGTKPEMKEIMARNIPAERMEQGPQMGGLT